ncbi:hypothetical protein B0H12DRAFT_1241787 [Mycena haematopus]|nr:hypothetical protein B0H12DRAFT_1241787 [Mycena haematopus]
METSQGEGEVTWRAWQVCREADADVRDGRASVLPPRRRGGAQPEGAKAACRAEDVGEGKRSKGPASCWLRGLGGTLLEVGVYGHADGVRWVEVVAAQNYQWRAMKGILLVCFPFYTPARTAAETGKCAHVTFLLDGSAERQFAFKREMGPSHKVATHDLQPEMNVQGVADTVARLA